MDRQWVKTRKSVKVDFRDSRHKYNRFLFLMLCKFDSFNKFENKEDIGCTLCLSRTRRRCNIFNAIFNGSRKLAMRNVQTKARKRKCKSLESSPRPRHKAEWSFRVREISN